MFLQETVFWGFTILDSNSSEQRIHSEGIAILAWGMSESKQIHPFCIDGLSCRTIHYSPIESSQSEHPILSTLHLIWIWKLVPNLLIISWKLPWLCPETHISQCSSPRCVGWQVPISEVGIGHRRHGGWWQGHLAMADVPYPSGVIKHGGLGYPL